MPGMERERKLLQQAVAVLAVIPLERGSTACCSVRRSRAMR